MLCTKSSAKVGLFPFSLLWPESASVVCWESQEVKSKISWSPKYLQSQQNTIPEGGASPYSWVCICEGPLPAFQSEGFLCVPGFYLPFPSQLKHLHVHVLTTTHITILLSSQHWTISFSIWPSIDLLTVYCVPQVAISRVSRIVGLHSPCLYPNNNIIHPNYSNTPIIWHLSVSLHSKPLLWWKRVNCYKVDTGNNRS